jgi:hypothetical protein
MILFRYLVPYFLSPNIASCRLGIYFLLGEESKQRGLKIQGGKAFFGFLERTDQRFAKSASLDKNLLPRLTVLLFAS